MSHHIHARLGLALGHPVVSSFLFLTSCWSNEPRHFLASSSSKIYFSLQDPRHLIKEDTEEREFDPRSILANLPPLPALEAFNKHRDFLANSQLLAGLGGHGRVPFTAASLGALGFAPPHTTFSPLPSSIGGAQTPGSTTPAPRPPSQPATPSSQQSSSPIQQNFSSQQNWSFEEQFKQVGQF